ncbi:MAG: flagellar filament capping protein FliD [Ruminococcaceae bacterium]|nr:flagellar filament capping protein FliD [Oscillospiraceae bacterium]
MANATSALRMSGMNSGLDTEAIVNALTSTTKSKINTSERKVLKLQAQQEAYRSLITSFTNFKDKYFDILNGSTSLKSTGLFNSFKSTLTNSAGTNVNGVKVSSNVNANPGTYKVKVNQVATQATLKSSGTNGKAVDLSKCNDSNETYTMSVSVNGKNKNITFKGGTEAEVRDNINAQLSVFGTKTDGSNIVSIGSDNKFTSSDKSAVVTGSATLYKDTRDLGNIGNMQTGNNTFTVTVGDTTKTVTFSTIASDYFDDIFDDDGNIKEDADQDKVELFKEIALNQREGEVYDEFKLWDNNLTDAQKKAFSENMAQARYNAAMNNATESLKENAKNCFANDMLSDIEKHIEYYETETGDGFKANTQDMTAEQQALFTRIVNDYNDKYGIDSGAYDPKDPNFVTFKQYFRGEFTDTIKSAMTEADVDSYIANDETGQKLYENYQKEVQKIKDDAQANTDKAVAREQKAAYNAQFAAAKQEAYDAKVASGEISSTEGDENYVSLANFKYTDDEFKTTAQYTAYEQEAQDIADDYANNGILSLDYDGLSEAEKMELFEEAGLYTGPSEEDYIAGYTKEEAVFDFNKANIENNLGALTFGNELTKLEATVEADGSITLQGKGIYTGNAKEFAITQSANNASDFGLDKTATSGTTSQVDTTSKLSELGLEADSNGNYSFSINGHDFTFSGDITVSDMMKQINASDAGVKMTYTTLTNQFTITANEYGRDTTIDIEDGDQGLLSALGFVAGQNFTQGKNTILEVNGVDVETTSNSYTVDGTTFTFSQSAEGTEFTNEVSRDYSKPIEAIKSFVEDYNKLIDEVFGYVDDEPNSDYYFLTDDDIEEMDLSESQQNKWEKLANKGILYRDQTLTSIMSKLRSVIYNTVDAADGTKVGLYTLGITTSSNWTNHGKLQFDSKISDEEFESIFATYADEFSKLFTDPENGISAQFESIINSAVKTSGGPGERGTLVEKAGVSGTASATNNSIYKQIESLKSTITKLQKRYDQQQDRYWKIYSNMETLLGNINSQSSYINQLMGM